MRGTVSVSILATVLVTWAGTEARAGCANPAPGLKADQPNVDSETISVNYRGETFSLDIYSAYAAQSTSRSGVFCLRYEIENTSKKPVQMLYWPLASGLQIETLEPKAKPSIAITTLPGAPPVLGSTWVYAFLSETARTVAYQQNKQYVPFLRDEHRPTQQRDFGGLGELTLARYTQTAQIEAFELKDPRKFPEIGSQFTDQTSEIVASSFAEWDGKNYTIKVAVQRGNSSVNDLQAPFAYALAKSKSPSDLLSLIGEFKKSATPLPLRDNEFSSTYRSYPTFPSLYIVQQPITFVGPFGRVCFLAAAYSPVPIPENLMPCSVASL